MVRRLRYILGLLVIVLLFANLIALSSGASGRLFTFSGMIEIISSAPEIAPVFTSEIGYILGDWGIFNFLRDFINNFLQVLNFLLFIINALLQVVQYVVYFCQSLFIT